jgi:3-deoxy-D-manno-octulosonic-acid transferase
MRSPALAAYLLASRLADPLAAPILRRRLARGKEDGARLAERLGRAGLRRPAGRLVWLHAASVGEATSALPLIAALRAKDEAAVLLTTGTVTSARRMAAVLPPGVLHQFAPVDTHRAVRRFLGHWRPDLALWIESELWPRLVFETAGRGVPMALVNARLSAASLRRWRRLPAMARRLLGSFRAILAQDEETVAGLAGLGVAARFAGNLKALVEAPGCDAGELAAARTALGRRPVWLAASTHAGEEAEAIRAQTDLRGSVGPLLIVAPRHPERGDEVMGLLARAGLRTARRSAGEMPGAPTEVWLADTLGEMGLWYRLAPVAFVGGSLVPAGGHTPFEPVALGAAVLHGPHVANFAPAYAALDAGRGAVAVADAAGLAAAVGRLLGAPAEAEALRERARAVHARLKPDLGAIADELLGLMRGPA